MFRLLLLLLVGVHCHVQWKLVIFDSVVWTQGKHTFPLNNACQQSTVTNLSSNTVFLFVNMNLLCQSAWDKNKSSNAFLLTPVCCVSCWICYSHHLVTFRTTTFVCLIIFFLYYFLSFLTPRGERNHHYCIILSRVKSLFFTGCQTTWNNKIVD